MIESIIAGTVSGALVGLTVSLLSIRRAKLDRLRRMEHLLQSQESAKLLGDWLSQPSRETT